MSAMKARLAMVKLTVAVNPKYTDAILAAVLFAQFNTS
jgi:hypothetical protein